VSGTARLRKEALTAVRNVHTKSYFPHCITVCFLATLGQAFLQENHCWLKSCCIHCPVVVFAVMSIHVYLLSGFRSFRSLLLSVNCHIEQIILFCLVYHSCYIHCTDFWAPRVNSWYGSRKVCRLMSWAWKMQWLYYRSATVLFIT